MPFMNAQAATDAILSAPGGYDINAVMKGWKDRGVWRYYDNVRVAANFGILPQTLTLFAIPLNSPDPLNGNVAKTKVNTNGTMANSMPANRCLVLDHLGIYFGSEMLKSDIDNILDGAYMEFKIEEKIYWEGPLWMYPSGLSLFGVSTTQGESAWNLGLPSPQAALHYGKFSKYIAPLQPFTWTIYFPGTPPTPATDGAGIVMYGEMYGLTDRSVQ